MPGFTQVTIGPCTLYHGDSRDIVPTLAPVDAVVTDPPYGLRFMGKAWDYSVPDVDLWRAILGASKPGAHLLAFAGTRTQHRMAVNIEDAGYEIRDMIAWVYGSGFPKSLDVSKAIDKAAGAERGEEQPHPTNQCKGGQWCKCQSLDATGRYSPTKHPAITLPATPSARQWSGWGTALKPALEPITVARKPLCGTVAENVLEHGTGAINVDECRVGVREVRMLNRAGSIGYQGSKPQGIVQDGGCGRFPANLIHDGSDEATTPLGSAARFFYTAKANGEDRGNHVKGALPLFGVEEEAWRNKHPTVKPTALMAYLCRLVTPPGGVVLDPFMGSGSTAIAAMREGFRFIGIERDEEHFKTACERVGNELNNK